MMNFQNYVMLLNIGVALPIALLALQNLKIPSSIHLAILSFAVAFWSLAYLLYDLKIVAFPKSLLISLVYFFSTIAATTLLTFSLTYGGHLKRIAGLAVALLTIEPLVTQVLFWVAPWREMFFLERNSSTAFISLHSGAWSEINSIYLYNIEIASLILLTNVLAKKPRPFLFQGSLLVAGVFAPIVFQLFELISQPSSSIFNPTIIGYSIAVIGLAYGLLRSGNMIELTPITYERVIGGMTDGWIVLDLNNAIIDVNPSAEKILGTSRFNLYGKPIRSIFPDWPDFSGTIGSGKELEMRRSILTWGNWRYLNVRISNLTDEAEKPFGKLIVWRDITERKLAEEARQRARDEMFVLLNAVSNAASHSIKLDDFLSESIYQLIFPFQSQMAAVLLSEHGNNNSQDAILRLAAHFGFSPAGARDMDVVFVNVSVFDEIMHTKQPLIIQDVNVDPRIPSAFRDAEIASLILLPLFTQSGENSKLLGIMFLGRREVIPYTHDEVIRLTTIAEQIANLIDSDRRRQLAIALSEREKLMRNLHDSVSQKLYGLVTLTEAAQAALEAGSKVTPSQVLTRIGDNARQAVKEMRLFLYQMQPIDLEKGGLVSALHYRLGAVEGRADIRARLLADEDISISKDKEVALYYIAQEALNNILKHANANTISVKFKQMRQNVMLEIVDNGNGFDPQKVESGGMGLQNMKARAVQVKGKLKIISKPGEGTTVRATVERERISGYQKKRRMS